MFQSLDRPTAAPEYIGDSDVDKHIDYIKTIAGIIRRFESYQPHALLEQDNEEGDSE